MNEDLVKLLEEKGPSHFTFVRTVDGNWRVYHPVKFHGVYPTLREAILALLSCY